MNEKIQRIIIQWFELNDGEPQLQIRRYKNLDNANTFIQSLSSRGVKNYKKKIIYKGVLEGGENNE